MSASEGLPLSTQVDFQRSKMLAQMKRWMLFDEHCCVYSLLMLCALLLPRHWIHHKPTDCTLYLILCHLFSYSNTILGNPKCFKAALINVFVPTMAQVSMCNVKGSQVETNPQTVSPDSPVPLTSTERLASFSSLFWHLRPTSFHFHHSHKLHFRQQAALI